MRHRVNIGPQRQGFFSWAFSGIFAIVIVVVGLWFAFDFFNSEFGFDLGAIMKKISIMLKENGL
jgi:hypothetical protein